MNKIITLVAKTREELNKKLENELNELDETYGFLRYDFLGKGDEGYMCTIHTLAPEKKNEINDKGTIQETTTKGTRTKKKK